MDDVARKIVYSGYRNDYHVWAKALWNKGFNYCISDVMPDLNVSLSWIKHTLLKEIHYVTYSYKYLYQKGIKSRVTTYVDKEELSQWIEKKAKFRRQTELVDLYSYLSLANKKKADIVLKMYKEITSNSNIGYNPGIIPEKVLQQINGDYFINFSPKNLNCTKRNKVTWKNLEPFNIFEKEIYFPGNITDELLYRKAFMNGDTKVTIGKKKTIFVKNPVNVKKMKMPFLIPYNKKISIQNRQSVKP